MRQPTVASISQIPPGEKTSDLTALASENKPPSSSSLLQSSEFLATVADPASKVCSACCRRQQY